MDSKDKIIDSNGTTAEEARKNLSALCENGFDGDIVKFAVALGREREEIAACLSGEEQIDDDLLMKIRGLAQERNIEIE